MINMRLILFFIEIDFFQNLFLFSTDYGSQKCVSREIFRFLKMVDISQDFANLTRLVCHGCDVSMGGFLICGIVVLRIS